mgnify:CR=1 FL=1
MWQIGPNLVADLEKRVLNINRVPLVHYESVGELITAQLLLHHIINPKYSNNNYYRLIEVVTGSMTKKTKQSDALKTFLNVISLQNGSLSFNVVFVTQTPL